MSLKLFHPFHPKMPRKFLGPLFRPVKPFFVYLYLKTETCIHLNLLVCTEPLFILNMDDKKNSSVIRRFKIVLWLSECENISGASRNGPYNYENGFVCFKGTVAYIRKHNKRFLKHNTIFLKHKSIFVKHNTKLSKHNTKLSKHKTKLSKLNTTQNHRNTAQNYRNTAQNCGNNTKLSKHNTKLWKQHKIVETQHKIGLLQQLVT